MANMFRPLRAGEIECRISQIAKDGSYLTLLLYKDARCDQNILDETVGPMNWKREHSRDNRNCTVYLWDKDKAQWIGKEDTGTESNTEREKGLASDSFKRACFNWGIGRELYSAPFIKIGKENAEIKQFNGKWTCYDHFSVKSIVTENGRIVGLKIYSPKKRKMVFVWGKDAPDPDPEIDKPEAEEDIPDTPPTPSATVTTSDKLPEWNAREHIKQWLTQNKITANTFTKIWEELKAEKAAPDKNLGELTLQECTQLLTAVKARAKA